MTERTDRNGRRLLHVLCDYAKGDLAFSEIITVLTLKLPGDVRVHTTEVPSFDTIATGFVLAQLGLQSPALRPKEMFLFVNCAPRRDRKNARVDNEGERVVYGVLRGGVPLLAVNSGHTLSFVRNDLEQLHVAQIPSHGSQFRSRDIFPDNVAQMVDGDLRFVGEKLDPSAVCSTPPVGVAAYVDSFGNIKTTYRSGHDKILAELTPGQVVGIRVGKDYGVQRALVATGSFNVAEGELAFAPGSSGHGERYWELFLRGGRATELFGSPKSGTPIEIEV